MIEVQSKQEADEYNHKDCSLHSFHNWNKVEVICKHEITDKQNDILNRIYGEPAGLLTTINNHDDDIKWL